MTCKKCKQTSVENLFLPCRHLVTCEAYASNMENCVTCNVKILGMVETYVMYTIQYNSIQYYFIKQADRTQLEMKES